MKLINGLTKHLNTYTSLLLYIQSNHRNKMLAENGNLSDYFMHLSEVSI